MASTPSLVKHNTFSKAVAESMVQLHQLSKEALSQKARGEPQWSKYGQKIIDLVELWENALSEEKQQQYEAEEATRTPNKRKGGSHDEDFAARFAARKKGGGIEKFPSARKEKEKAKRKWAHVNHEGGYGSPLKKGYQANAIDEDDEEQLPVGVIKQERSIKIESDDDMTIGAESETE